MKRLASAAGSDVLTTTPAACIFLFPSELEDSWERALAVYVLPLAVVAAIVMFVIWRMHTKDIGALTRISNRRAASPNSGERERDLAQEELFRRLYEERELNKEKTQFQSRLAEYEKYAALAQLALGAAHTINNPLVGILSHLELELKVATDPDAH